ncbi:hypothetical protein [Cupriavidus nantongensis]|uniref:Uncharacterized protein n=1 Tax=Cupriavidus nantongensis TaxID=1796606 RepID=A0A142JHS9_9BURK|nr:hypothetical protein [Cupriavidus nantongensis]AMR77641.1 hypothetical protein A2G96_07775 [Cupriavidus nantongensis]
MNTTELSYGTAAERAFLNQLALGRKAALLLRNYIAAAEKRVAWGSIDKTQVVSYAEQLLREVVAEEAAEVQQVSKAA